MAKSQVGFSCGCLLLILVVNLLIGGACVDYCLWYYVGVDVPLYADMVIGLVAGEVAIPAAIVAWVPYHCGVGQPLFGKGG